MTVEQVRRALDEMLDATPPPPEPSLDPTDVLEQGLALLDRRQRAFEALCAALDDSPTLLVGDPHGERMAKLLLDRDAGWAAALKTARSEVGLRMGSLRKLRRAQGGIHGR